MSATRAVGSLRLNYDQRENLKGFIMLENFAHGLLNRSESELNAVGLLLAAAGFSVALLARRGATLSMRRVPYLIWTGILLSLITVLPLAWLLTFEAAANGRLWVLVTFVFVGIFAGGAAAGILGHARSVNAYGDGSKAWMAIVPFINIVLLVRRPLDWAKGTWVTYALGTLGVVFGLFLMVQATVTGKVIGREIDAMALRAKSDPVMQQVGVGFMLRNQGLESTLRQIAADVPSQQVDEMTTLVRAESDGTTLRYVYEVSTDISTLPESTRMGLLDHNCSYAAVRPLLTAGATFEHLYLHLDGSEIGTATVTRQLCGY